MFKIKGMPSTFSYIFLKGLGRYSFFPYTYEIHFLPYQTFKFQYSLGTYFNYLPQRIIFSITKKYSKFLVFYCVQDNPSACVREVSVANFKCIEKCYLKILLGVKNFDHSEMS